MEILLLLLAVPVVIALKILRGIIIVGLGVVFTIVWSIICVLYFFLHVVPEYGS